MYAVILIATVFCIFPVAHNNEKLQDSQCIFELTPTQADQIRNARYILKNVFHYQPYWLKQFKYSYFSLLIFCVVSELRAGMRSIQVVLR